MVFVRIEWFLAASTAKDKTNDCDKGSCLAFGSAYVCPSCYKMYFYKGISFILRHLTEIYNAITEHEEMGLHTLTTPH